MEPEHIFVRRWHVLIDPDAALVSQSTTAERSMLPTFDVRGTENWGMGEIRGNAVKDLAALMHLNYGVSLFGQGSGEVHAVRSV